MTTLPIPPGPQRRNVVGHLRDFNRDPLDFFVRMRDYGDVVRFMQWPIDGYLLNHPDDIKDLLVTHNKNFANQTNFHRWLSKAIGEGLLTSNGDFHLRQRRLIQPVFHRQRIGSYAGIMVKHAQKVTDAWRNGDKVAVDEDMMQITLCVVSEALFGQDSLDEDTIKRIGEAMNISNHYLSMRPTQPLGELWHRLPLPSTRRFLQAQTLLDGIAYRFIRERRASGQRTDDLLSLLLDAQDTEGDGTGMSDKQIKDEASTLFAAGHETTANALMWTWYLLSQNPDAEARFHAELDAALGDHAPTLDDAPRLTYTHQVFSESLRLYPPAWSIGRIALNDYTVRGYTIPKGSVVVMAPYSLHRDARYYPEPTRFDPSRWTKEAETQRPKFAYVPFGAGPRQCIGEHFAWLEGVLVLATIGRTWRLRLAPDCVVATNPLITLRAKHGMQMIAERRK
jgi:cytochrome P450